jgi:hypothetical protein
VAKDRPEPRPESSVAGLTYRQRLFVCAYLGTAAGNATEAARAAGYAQPHSQGPRLLANVGIRAAIAAKLAGAALAAEEVLARLSDMASADLADFLAISPKGHRVDLAKARRAGKTHLIKKLSPTRYGLAIELHDARGALELLGKYHGLFDRIDMGDAKTEELEARSAGPDPRGTGPA